MGFPGLVPGTNVGPMNGGTFPNSTGGNTGFVLPQSIKQDFNNSTTSPLANKESWYKGGVINKRPAEYQGGDWESLNQRFDVALDLHVKRRFSITYDFVYLAIEKYYTSKQTLVQTSNAAIMTLGKLLSMKPPKGNSLLS